MLFMKLLTSQKPRGLRKPLRERSTVCG